MTTSTATVATAAASRHLQQLCKHFAHKVPATCTPEAGTIDFPIGQVALAAADETLTLALTAPDAARLAELKDVVARHLVRFAFRETLTIDWQDAVAP